MSWSITSIGAAIAIIATGFLIMLICNYQWRKRMERETRLDLYYNVVPHWNKSAKQENYCAHCEHGVTQHNRAGKLMRVDCAFDCECNKFTLRKEQ